MKKLLMLALSMALLLCAVSAPAETAEKEALGTVGRLDVNGVFTVQSRIPEGYTHTPIDADELGLTSILTSGDGSVMVTVSIRYSEEYADVERLNDVDDEGIEIIKNTFSEMDDVSFEDLETAYGTRLLKVTETEGSTDFVDIYTIYKGYELEFVIVKLEGELTEDDIRMMVDFISDMDFVAS